MFWVYRAVARPDDQTAGFDDKPWPPRSNRFPREWIPAPTGLRRPPAMGNLTIEEACWAMVKAEIGEGCKLSKRKVRKFENEVKILAWRKTPVRWARCACPWSDYGRRFRARQPRGSEGYLPTRASAFPGRLRVGGSWDEAGLMKI